MGADRLAEVLDATYVCLARYGVRRTTMDDIAGQMGVSRSALYQYVRSKDDAFRRLAGRLHAQALERARRAATADAPWTQRVRGILEAKLDLVLELAGDSPHTAELLDAKGRLFGDICRAFTAELSRLLIEAFREADTPGGPAPGHPTALEPARAADICLALAAGLETVPGGRQLLGPATDALLAGLSGAQAVTHSA
jgi:AcrR family transcriptional regulator